MYEPPKPHISSDSFGVYIHVPFCMSKCPYCDFNSFATSKEELSTKESVYVEALISEFKSQVIRFGLEGRKCDSVFFGGGTPSYLTAESIDEILKNIFSKLEFDKNIEITLEANPLSLKEDLSVEKFKNLKRAGINRLSFGSQSLRAEKLKFLGRWHEPDDIFQSVLKSRECGFANLSCDFIGATKLDSKDVWIEELQLALTLNTNHLSAYLLTIEPGTQFGVQAKKGAEFTCSEEEASEIYIATQDFFESKGYRQYEISNYSKPGFECAHNLLYWRGGEYLGLGAGAHSHLLEAGLPKRWANTPKPEVYQQRIRAEGQAEQLVEAYNQASKESELLLLRFRLSEGLLLDECSDLLRAYESGRLDYMMKQGFFAVHEGRAHIPKDKFILADSVISELSALV